ncbi:eukaryotic translation initiation factor 3 subunit M, partial [Tachysurus ichikawai]
ASELRAYIKAKGADISEENSEGGLHVDLAQIIEACDVCLKDEDKDVESVMNSIVSLLLILETEKQEALIESLCEKLVKFREGERPTLRMQLLSNLFHGMDENVPVRHTVYCSLIKVAAACNAIAFIPTDLDQVRKWIVDWNLSTEKKHTLLRLVYDALVDCKKSEAAAKVMVELLGSYTEDNASQARVDAHRCIVRALKDTNTFLFDHLLALKPVRFLEGELIHDLLTIFVSAKLVAYVKFYQSNKDFIDSLGEYFRDSTMTCKATAWPKLMQTVLFKPLLMPVMIFTIFTIRLTGALNASPSRDVVYALECFCSAGM